MKLNIVILEIDVKVIGEIKKYLNKWAENISFPMQIRVFNSYTELLINGMLEFDLIFIKVGSKGFDGLDIARDLRRHEFSGEIVLLSTLQEYAIKGYEVHALYYFTVPVTYDQIKVCMEYMRNKKRCLFYKYTYRKSLISIPFKEILYFSSSDHHTNIYLYREDEIKVLQQFKALSKIQPYLPSGFKPCYRGIIVNMAHVCKIDGRNLFLLCNIKLPISDTYYEDVIESFMNTK